MSLSNKHTNQQIEIQFECKNSTINMNQSRYIEKILPKFAMADCKPCSTSCEIGITEPSNEVDWIDSKPYHEIIGSLIYIMIARRPDICYTINRLSQDLAKPNSFHLTKAKHVSRYFKSTINQTLISLKNPKALDIRGILWSRVG